MKVTEQFFPPVYYAIQGGSNFLEANERCFPVVLSMEEILKCDHPKESY